MDPDTATLAAAIGSRVRSERKARRWTLDRLAEAAGVSRRMLVNVEQGAANPSIGILLRLSDALGLGLPALVEPPMPTADVTVTRAGEGATLWNGDHGGSGVLVGGTEPPEVVELWDWRLGPGDQHSSEPHAQGTMELLHVQEGTVTVVVANETITLDAGDAVTFSGDVAHSYANRGAREGRFSLAVFEPRVGSSPRRKDPDD